MFQKISVVDDSGTSCRAYTIYLDVGVFFFFKQNELTVRISCYSVEVVEEYNTESYYPNNEYLIALQKYTDTAQAIKSVKPHLKLLNICDYNNKV